MPTNFGSLNWSGLENSMISPIVQIFSSRCYRSRYLYRFLVRIARTISLARKREFVFDSTRFERSAWVSRYKEHKSGNHDKEIDIVIVSTSKDFDILPYALDFAVGSLSKYRLGEIRVVVPEKDYALCLQLLSEKKIKVTVVNEETIVTSDQLVKLKSVFQGRATWILQQLLKINSVKASQADAVLILDSDTILLRRRPWFSSSGQQILMPTFEYNFYYYEFLNRLGVSETTPNHTFISHHMIMQPKIVERLFRNIGLLNIEDQVEFICANADRTTQSPICFEYELYAQFLLNEGSQLFFFERWSNISIPRRYFKVVLSFPGLKRTFSFFYNSISFHSWS